jgi:hypothetical protein
MSNEETNSLYLCTVHDYHRLYRWDTGSTPSQAMELQEMVVDGQGNRETGGSSSDRTSVGVHTDMTGENNSGDTQSKFPPARQLS